MSDISTANALRSAIYVTVKSSNPIPPYRLVFSDDEGHATAARASPAEIHTGGHTADAEGRPAAKRRRTHREDGQNRSQDLPKLISVTEKAGGTPIGVSPAESKETESFPSKRVHYLAVAIAGPCFLTNEKSIADARAGDCIYLMANGSFSRTHNSTCTHSLGRVIAPPATDSLPVEIFLQIIEIAKLVETDAGKQKKALTTIKGWVKDRSDIDPLHMVILKAPAFTTGEELPPLTSLNDNENWNGSGGQRELLLNLLKADDEQRYQSAKDLFDVCPMSYGMGTLTLDDIFDLPLGYKQEDRCNLALEFAIRALAKFHNT